MQKFLRFEITMAMKDRPKIFQLITLVLFSFSITIVLVSSLSRLSLLTEEKTVMQQNKATNYAGYVAAPTTHLVRFKK